MRQQKLLFLTLNTFSSTGGIEKVCRIAGKAFFEIATEAGFSFEMYSMYDHQNQVIEKYIPRSAFEAFGGQRAKFVAEAVKTGRKCDTVVLSHINLLLIGYLIKSLSPKTKVILIAHGIEVWQALPGWKKQMLRKLDLILPVSEFTKNKMLTQYGLDPNKLVVLNNCLDPFLTKKLNGSVQRQLKIEMGFDPESEVIFTLTRLKSSEQYKGYDRVISAMPAVLEKHPSAKYLIAGKYDDIEKQRLDKLIKELKLDENIVFYGFAKDEEIEKLFKVADVYVMPSTGEGFGIVFIEAMFYGKPVIAGDMDGSVDAVDNGRLGMLVKPDNIFEIAEAIDKVLQNKPQHIPNISQVMAKFSFETYRNNFAKVLGVKRSAKVEEFV